jgi:ribokinase
MIIVIGSINLDLSARVARLPQPGETVQGRSLVTAPGGKGANQALAAARAGATVRLVGAVGRDAFAGQALALLKAGSVDLSAVLEAEEPTGTALILVDGKGENMIAVVPGANGTVHPGRVAEIPIGAGDCLLLQHEISLRTVEAALEAARKAGAVSLLNIAPFLAEAAPLFDRPDYLVANETEFDSACAALGIAGARRTARMETFVLQSGRTLIVTLGADGVAAATPEGMLAVPSLPVRPVDTVGAGDTFCGYLAAGLAEGLALEAALRRAAAAAALACLKPGAQPSIPLRQEVEAVLLHPSR